MRTFECDIRANVLYIEGSLKFNVCRHFFNSPVCGDFSCLNGKVPEKIHAVLQNFFAEQYFKNVSVLHSFVSVNDMIKGRRSRKRETIFLDQKNLHQLKQ